MPFGTNPDSGGVILLSGAAMSSLDAADSQMDGEIMITQVRQEGTWKLDGKADSFIELDRIASESAGATCTIRVSSTMKSRVCRRPCDGDTR